MDVELRNTNFRFLTLTLDTKRFSQDSAAAIINTAWDTLLKRIKRKFKAIKYLKIIEFTKAGYVHIHALINIYISNSWLSAAWNEIGMGYIIKIKKVRTVAVGSYLAKYLSKFSELDIQDSYKYYRYSLRRYTTSRDFYKIVKGVSLFWEDVGPLPEVARHRLSFYLSMYLCEFCVLSRSDPDGLTFIKFVPKFQ